MHPWSGQGCVILNMQYSFRKTKHWGSTSLVSLCHLCIWHHISSPNRKLALYCWQIPMYIHRCTHTQSNFLTSKLLLFNVFIYQFVNGIKHNCDPVHYIWEHYIYPCELDDCNAKLRQIWVLPYMYFGITYYSEGLFCYDWEKCEYFKLSI